jgi:hypothetical protein
MCSESGIWFPGIDGGTNITLRENKEWVKTERRRGMCCSEQRLVITIEYY